MIFLATFFISYCILFIQQIVNDTLSSYFFQITIIGIISRVLTISSKQKSSVVSSIILGAMIDSTQNVPFGITIIFFLFFDALQRVFVYTDSIVVGIQNVLWSGFINFSYILFNLCYAKTSIPILTIILEIAVSQLIVLIFSYYFFNLTVNAQSRINEKINFSKKSLF